MIENFEQRIFKCQELAKKLYIRVELDLNENGLTVAFNDESFSQNSDEWELDVLESELNDKIKAKRQKELDVEKAIVLWEQLPEESRKLIKENISYLK